MSYKEKGVVIFLIMHLMFCMLVDCSSDMNPNLNVPMAPPPPTTIIEITSPNLPSSSLESKQVSVTTQQEKQEGDKNDNSFIAYPYDSSYTSSSLEIERSIEPNEEDYYIEKCPIRIIVNIKSKSSYQLSNITIKEEIDPNLEILNESRYYIIDPSVDSLIKTDYKKGKLFKKVNNNTFRISLDKLGPKKWIKYVYDLNSGFCSNHFSH